MNQHYGEQFTSSLNIDTFICPSITDYSVGGNIYSEKSSTVQVIVKRCDNATAPSGVVCKTTDEINAIMEFLNVIILPSNYFFDDQDYKSPIKLSVENEFMFPVVNGFETHKELRIKANKADDYNSIFYPSFKTEYSYYTIDSVNDATKLETRFEVVFRVTLRLDHRSNFIERKVYTLYDMFGQIGGVIGLVVPAGALLANFFSSTIYEMTLLTRFYKIKTENKVNASNKVHVREREFVPRITNKSSCSNGIIEERKNISQCSDINFASEPPPPTILDNIKLSLATFSRYKFKWKYLFYILLSYQKFK